MPRKNIHPNHVDSPQVHTKHKKQAHPANIVTQIGCLVNTHTHICVIPQIWFTICHIQAHVPASPTGGTVYRRHLHHWGNYLNAQNSTV